MINSDMFEDQWRLLMVYMGLCRFSVWPEIRSNLHKTACLDEEPTMQSALAHCKHLQNLLALSALDRLEQEGVARNNNR